MIIYRQIIVTQLWTCFLQIYTIGRSRDWPEARMVSYWFFFQFFWLAWGAYADPDDVGSYWMGILPADIYAEWGDRVRLHPYRKDIDDHMVLIAMQRREYFFPARTYWC